MIFLIKFVIHAVLDSWIISYMLNFDAQIMIHVLVNNG